MPLQSRKRPEDAPPPTITTPNKLSKGGGVGGGEGGEGGGGGKGRSSSSIHPQPVHDEDIENLATPPPRRIASASQTYGLRNDAAETPTRESPEKATQEPNVILSNVDPDTVAVARGELGGNLGPYAVSVFNFETSLTHNHVHSKQQN